MAVDATLMFNEVDLVIKNGQGHSNYRLELEILVNDQWIKPYRINHYNRECDYAEDWGESIMISADFGLGDYTCDMIPNRKNLLAELRFVPLHADSSAQRSDENTSVERYRCILVSQENQGLTAKNAQATNREMLNRNGVVQVELQLIDEINYLLNMTPTGGSYRTLSTMDVMKLMLTTESAKIGGKDRDRILGLEITPGFSVEKRQVIKIAHGKKLVNVPLILQNEEGGVYPTGLGRFVQDQYWWIYPLYDVERVNTKLRRLVIYNVPSNRYDGAEKTYRVDDKQVVVLATGDSKSLDPSLFNHLNTGNGVRFVDARKLLDGFGTVKDNRMLVDRATNLFEVASQKLGTDVNNIGWGKQGSTGNPLKQYSELARADGQVVMVVWRHGDSDLLKPGMPVEYNTVFEDELVRYKGVLHGVQEQRIPSLPGAMASRFPSSIVLKIFLKTYEPV